MYSADRRPRRPTRSPAPATLEQVSFTGMRDSPDPATAHPRKAKLLRNVYPQDPQIGGPLVGRPGWAHTGTLGSVSRRRYQGQAQFRKPDGSERTVCFVGGYMMERSWSSEAWNTITDIYALYGLSVSADIQCAVLGQYLVISDGVVRPVVWDGTAFAPLDNCPPLYGPPRIYAAQLFGIKATERNAIVWSEVNDPFTGYEAGGYNNAWTLGQTSQDDLTAIFGTNEALYFWRANSVGKIVGAISAEFLSSTTHDAISQTTGTLSPAGVVAAGGFLYFLDADRQPQRLVIGGGLDSEMAAIADSRETCAEMPRALLPEVRGAHLEALGLVLFTFGSSAAASSDLDRILTVEASTGSFCGVWDGVTFSCSALGVVKDGDGAPTLVHGDAFGNVLIHGAPDGDRWTDAGATIQHEVVGTALGWDTKVEKAFTRADITLRGTVSQVAVSVQVPRESWRPQLDVVVTAPPDGADAHIAVGLSARGPWARVRVYHAVSGEQFGLLGLSASVQPIAAGVGGNRL